MKQISLSSLSKETQAKIRNELAASKEKMSWAKDEPTQDDIMEVIDDAFQKLIDKTAKYYKMNDEGEVKRNIPAIKKYIAEEMFKKIPTSDLGIAALKKISKQDFVDEQMEQLIENYMPDYDMTMLLDANSEDYVDFTKDIVKAAKEKLNNFHQV